MGLGRRTCSGCLGCVPLEIKSSKACSAYPISTLILLLLLATLILLLLTQPTVLLLLATPLILLLLPTLSLLLYLCCLSCSILAVVSPILSASLPLPLSLCHSHSPALPLLSACGAAAATASLCLRSLSQIEQRAQLAAHQNSSQF